MSGELVSLGVIYLWWSVLAAAALVVAWIVYRDGL